MKGKNLQPRILYPARLSFRFDGEIKTFSDKQKRIQHYQTNFTTNAKGTSLGRKHKRRKRLTENKPKTIKKIIIGSSVQFSHSVVYDSAIPWPAAHQASLSITSSQNLPKPMSIALVMQSNHLILCHPILLPPSIFPSIRVFSKFFTSRGQSAGVSASTSVLPKNIQD